MSEAKKTSHETVLRIRPAFCEECGEPLCDELNEEFVCGVCEEHGMGAEYDGQPDEYTEWQDYMGGDEYYDHSEAQWDYGDY